MNDITRPAEPSRPLWQWILYALSPSLAYLAISPIALIDDELAVVSMMVGMALPLVALIVLLIVANKFFRSRNDPSQWNRILFVIGFGFVNGLIWMGGCAITASNLSFH